MKIIQKILSIFEKETEPIDIGGLWYGIYKYRNTNSHEFESERKIVEFNADFKYDSSQGFSGTITEAENGVPEIAEVSGKIKKNQIVFIKKYKHIYQLDQNGVTHRLDQGPMYINYSGKYDTHKAKYFGRWRIEVEYEYEDGRKVISSSAGFWEMWRKELADA